MHVQGLGIEVLAQILDSTSPSHIMQLHTDNPNNNLPPDAWWQPDPGGSYAQPLSYHLPSANLCQQEVTLGSPGVLVVCCGKPDEVCYGYSAVCYGYFVVCFDYSAVCFDYSAVCVGYSVMYGNGHT